MGKAIDARVATETGKGGRDRAAFELLLLLGLVVLGVSHVER